MSNQCNGGGGGEIEDSAMSYESDLCNGGWGRVGGSRL